MIYTQRFFTILLGLWFAMVLTDQASALYDPGVERFCSRDPIKYKAGANLYSYVKGKTLIYLDPNGHDGFVVVPAPTGPSFCWSRGGDDEERTYETATICVSFSINDNCKLPCCQGTSR